MGYLQCKHGSYDCALCPKTPEPAPQAAFDQEVRDADELLRLLNLPPDCYRTDGGYINLPKVKAAVREPWDYPTIEPVNPPVAVAVGAAPLPDDVQRIVDRLRTIYAQSAASADNENYSCVFSLKDCRKTTDMLERLARERDHWQERAEARLLGNHELVRKITSAQAREAKLRKVLHSIGLCEFNSMSSRQEMGTLAREAFALPTDDSALREALAQERERCAKVCADHPGHVPSNNWNASSALGSCDQTIRGMK